jgi:hypothetical protein
MARASRLTYHRKRLFLFSRTNSLAIETHGPP